MQSDCACNGNAFPHARRRCLPRLQVGIIPTDTLPALVCCVEDRKAAAKLYAIKELDPKKPLSILCR